MLQNVGLEPANYKTEVRCSNNLANHNFNSVFTLMPIIFIYLLSERSEMCYNEVCSNSRENRVDPVEKLLSNSFH